MINKVKFKLKSVTEAVSGQYLTIETPDRELLKHVGPLTTSPTGELEILLDGKGTVGSDVLVWGANYNGTNPDTFEVFNGVSTIEEHILPDVTYNFASVSHLLGDEQVVSGDFEFNARLKLNAPPSVNFLLFGDRYTTAAMVRSDGKIRFYAKHDGEESRLQTAVVDFTQWTDIKITLAGTTATVVVNGTSYTTEVTVPTEFIQSVFFGGPGFASNIDGEVETFNFTNGTQATSTYAMNSGTGLVKDMTGTHDLAIVEYQPTNWTLSDGSVYAPEAPRFTHWRELDAMYEVELRHRIPMIEDQGYYAVTFAFTGLSWFNFYIDMHTLSGDNKWIDRIIETVDFMLTKTDEALLASGELTETNYLQAPRDVMALPAAQGHIGWSLLFNGGRTVQLLEDSVICKNIMTAVDYILSNDLPVDKAKMDSYIDKCIAVLKTHDSEWRYNRYDGSNGTIPVQGSYYYTNRENTDALYSNPLGFNHTAGACEAMHYLCKYRELPEFKRKQVAFLDWFLDNLTESGAGYTWYYGLDKNGGPLTGNVEDVNHSTYQMTFLEKCYEDGLISDEVMTRFANTVFNFLGESSVSHYVDGTEVGDEGDGVSMQRGYIDIAKRFNPYAFKLITTYLNSYLNNGLTPIWHSHISAAAALLKASAPLGAPTESITILLGQSQAIGTLDASYNEKPLQPVLDGERFKMIAGVGTVGVQDTVLDEATMTGVLPYSESSPNDVSTEYYTPGTGILANLEGNRVHILAQAAIGGQSIEALSEGGATNSFENLRKQLVFLKANYPNAAVDNLAFLHGSANWSDSESVYMAKLLGYRDEITTLVKSIYPNSEPKFVLTQHGGEEVVKGVMQAQLEAVKSGEVIGAGSVYAVQRKYPNVSQEQVDNEGALAPERIHLNPDGYDFVGEMIGRALMTPDFKPLHVNGYEWSGDNKLLLSCHIPSGTLVVGATDKNLPLFPGYGIEIEKPNGTRLPASTVVLRMGNKIECTFPQPFLPGDRILIGFSPRDISYYDDYTPNVENPTFVSDHLVGTNIRTSTKYVSKVLRLDDVTHDWLSPDVITTTVKASTPNAVVLGSNIYRDKTLGYLGFGERFTFNSTDGTTTKLLDGEETTWSTTRSLGITTNKESAAWGIRKGRTYQVDFDMTGMNEAARIQFFVGGAGLTITSALLVNGHFTGLVTATEDFTYSINIRENSGFTLAAFEGVLSNIQIREKLPSRPVDIDRIFIFGASILEYGLGGDDLHLLEQSYLNKGINVEIVKMATGGHDVGQYLTKLDALLASDTGDMSRSMFVVHGPGNDIHVYPHNEALIRDSMTLLCQRIKASGAKLALSTLTHRIAPSAKVSEPYNTNIITPLINEYADIALDLNKVSTDNVGVWHLPDGVHPTPEGIILNNQHIVEVTSQGIKPNIVESTEFEKILLQIGRRKPFGTAKNVIAMPEVDFAVFNEKGERLTDSTVIVTGIPEGSGYYNDQGMGDPDADDAANYTVTNEIGTSDSFFIPGARTADLNLSKLPLLPNEDYIVNITGTRNVASDKRNGEYTIDADNIILIDAAELPVSVGTATVKGSVLLANGIAISVATGSEYAYLGMVSISKAV